MVLDLVEGQLDLPAVSVEGNQLLRRVLLGVEQGRAQVRDLVVFGEGNDAVGRLFRQDPAFAGGPQGDRNFPAA
ncbi:hypothetical protein [Streptomyces sp. NPDC127190]|uniref:hypothetical protein n=1 Tax=unclassified Streptomyces TaxID=2593676 RepID=UPI003638557C